MFALNLCAILMSFILASAGLMIADISGFKAGAVDSLWAIAALSAILWVIQAIQLPMFFKLGYSKAKIFSLVPFVALMIGFLAYTSMVRSSGVLEGANEFIDGFIGGSGWAISLGVLVLLLLMYVSYVLSLTSYKKREF